jgi:6-phospho-beta-glucosidase
MSQAESFRIAYIGGGSRFVVTLLHGLAGAVEDLTDLGRPIELVLMDPDTRRAGEMARYAEITAEATGLEIRPTVTDDLHETCDGADWVLLSISQWQAEHEIFGRLGAALGPEPLVEAGPWLAMTAVSIWPELCRAVGAMQRCAKPSAVFSTLVNPTDVLTGAVARAFDARACGICVEVGGLEGFLAYYLGVEPRRITLDHVGVNHHGWVGRWGIEGFDGDPDALFDETMARRAGADDWYPHCDWMVRVHRRLGVLATTAYHAWPFRRTWGRAETDQAARWARTCLGDEPKRQFRARMLAEALEAGRMIPQPDPLACHPEATPYAYPNSAKVLAAVSLGLAGGAAGPVALQVPNAGSNPDMPSQAVLELPADVADGRITPRRAAAIPEPQGRMLGLIARQRTDIAAWLADRRREDLARALLAMPEVAPLAAINRLIDQLQEEISRIPE